MSRKTNRGRRRRALGDHAKRQQRPMQEDEAIATQISALLTPALAKQKKYCRQLGLRDFHINTSVDGSCGFNDVMARCSRSQRINKNVS